MEESEKSAYLNDVEYFSAKVEQNPSSVLFVPLAKAYIKLEKYDEAVDVLTDGIDANPEAYSAKTLLAQAYMGQGEVGDAQAILIEVLATEKNNYLAHKLMGDILRHYEEIKKALVSYRNAIMLAPEDLSLQQLMEELMEAHGITANEIHVEPNLMDADDELLDQLSSELADQVRSEVGDDKLGAVSASDDEVSKAVDSIVGVDASNAADDMSVDNFQEGSADYGDELEEELMASFDDEIVQTPLSDGTVGGEKNDESGSVFKLDDEIMQSGGEAPSEDDVAALAAELGADLGLDIGDTPVVQDEVDEALNGIFDETEEKPAEGEGVDTGLSFFDGVEEDKGTELDADLMALLGGEPQTEAEPVAEPEPELDDDLKVLLGEEPSGDVEAAANAEAEIDDELKALLDGEPQTEVEPVAEPEPELDDDLKALLGEEPAVDADAESEDFDFDDMSAIDEETGEPVAEEAVHVDDAPEEIFEASMDELLEPAPEDAEDEYKNLTPEIREQVNRLENLLETIKNNAAN